MLLGNVCLLTNTLASAIYYLGAKRLVQVRLPGHQEQTSCDCPVPCNEGVPNNPETRIPGPILPDKEGSVE